MDNIETAKSDPNVAYEGITENGSINRFLLNWGKQEYNQPQNLENFYLDFKQININELLCCNDIFKTLISMDDSSIDILRINIEKVGYQLEHSPNINEFMESKLETNEMRKFYQSFFKLYDYVTFFAIQKRELEESKQSFKDELESSLNFKSSEIMNNIKKEIECNSEKIDEKLNQNTNNVIALIALFTAMAFMVFGGLTSFEGILSNIQEVSVVKLVILTSIWGIGILNLIAVFMLCISKTVNASFKQTTSGNATLFQKYPYIILGNFILLAVFISASWVYFCMRNSSNNKIINLSFLDTSNFWTVMNGSTIVIVLLYMLFYLLFRYKKNSVKEDTSD